VVLATKVFNRMGPAPNSAGLSRKHIMQGIDASLRRLGTDHVDIYQIHRLDPETPVEETLEALDDVVRAGKALYIGASSMYAWQFMRALALSDRTGRSRFVTMQDHYNLVYREEEREMIPLCVDQGIGIIPWSPLARGFLAGNRTPQKTGETNRSKSDEFAHRMYYQAEDFAIVDRVKALAASIGKTMPQVALAWMLSKPYITAPIVGASKLPHLEQAVEAASIRLDPQQIKTLEEPYRPHPVMGI
jgi:1-deoxyxylulose-5-phosphate synthase